MSVFDPTVITFGQFNSGSAHNIIPETAHLEGTIRTLSAKTRTLAHELVQTVAASTAAAFGAIAEVTITPGYPVTTNHGPFTSNVVMSTALELVGEGGVEEMDAPIMGAEDFSYVLEKVPGAMAMIGARPPEVLADQAIPNHSNRVVFHEPAMASGAALLAGVALQFLGAQVI